MREGEKERGREGRREVADGREGEVRQGEGREGRQGGRRQNCGVGVWEARNSELTSLLTTHRPLHTPPAPPPANPNELLLYTDDAYVISLLPPRYRRCSGERRPGKASGGEFVGGGDGGGGSGAWGDALGHHLLRGTSGQRMTKKIYINNRRKKNV